MLTFCLLSSSSTTEYMTFQPVTRSASWAVWVELCCTGFWCVFGCSNQKMPWTFLFAQNVFATLLTRARAVARGPVCPSVMTSFTKRLYSVVSPLSNGGFSTIWPLVSQTRACGPRRPRER
ncbi:hypothetical protein M413DRAFT_244135 [Hebeloma cylindrosporum]|uniref:Uncharacterized protein n=1 Tax=Hebeloma cylindrosporum TaxID=76867 RepID=A0A0C2XKL2_HEBCY|nr:hypothetical protein M413DRAFT_244135 [Hebeloma cylindrosporum h7]